MYEKPVCDHPAAESGQCRGNGRHGSILGGWTGRSTVPSTEPLSPPSMPTSAGKSSLPPIPDLETREKEETFLREIRERFPSGLAGGRAHWPCPLAPACAGRSHRKCSRPGGGYRGYGCCSGLCGQLLTALLPALIVRQTSLPMILTPLQ